MLTDLTCGSNNAFLPADTTDIEVFVVLYPAPGFTITASTILLLTIIGLIRAPVPLPVTTISGVE
jgi:hypothetical protein